MHKGFGSSFPRRPATLAGRAIVATPRSSELSIVVLCSPCAGEHHHCSWTSTFSQRGAVTDLVRPGYLPRVCDHWSSPWPFGTSASYAVLGLRVHLGFAHW